jgi:hypothetical protein
MNAFGALFASDADFVPVTGRWLRGQQEIQTYHAFIHGTIPLDTPGIDVPARAHGVFKATTFHFDQISVRFVRPDVAITHGAWTAHGDPRTNEPRHGMFTFVVVKDRGHWSITSAQNTEINRTVK